MTQPLRLRRLIGDWLVPDFDASNPKHREMVQKTVNAICLEMNITPELVEGLYPIRRQPHVDDAIQILKAFLIVAERP